jgi:hypothetical protein
MLWLSHQYSAIRASFVITGTPLEDDVNIWGGTIYSLHDPLPPPTPLLQLIYHKSRSHFGIQWYYWNCFKKKLLM